MSKSLDKFRNGTDSVREKLNRIVDELTPLMNIAGDRYIRVQRTRNGVAIGLSIPSVLSRMPRSGRDYFYARITDESSAGMYAWEEVELVGSSMTWSAVPGGRSGSTTSDAAEEFSGVLGLYDDSSDADDLIVIMYPIVTADGDVMYRFSAGAGSVLPAPGQQYMVLQLDAELQPVWDWVRAH